MKSTSMILLLTVILALIANLVAEEDCELSNIQHTVLTQGESVHKSWFSVKGSPASISIKKSTDSSIFNTVEYRFFNKNGTQSVTLNETFNQNEDLKDVFVGAIGPVIAFNYLSGKIVFVKGKDNSTPLKVLSYRLDSDFTTNASIPIDASQFTFIKFEGINTYSENYFTSWKDPNGKLYYMGTNGDSISIVGTIEPLEGENIIFISEKIAFDTNSFGFYIAVEENEQNIYRQLSASELDINKFSQNQIQPSDGFYFEVLPLNFQINSIKGSLISVIRGINPQNPAGGQYSVYRQAVYSCQQYLETGLKGKIPDLSYYPNQIPQLFLGPDGQVMEIVPEDSVFSVIMIVTTDYVNYVACYYTGQIDQSQLELSQVLQMTSTFNSVFAISENSLIVLEVTPTSTPLNAGVGAVVAQNLILDQTIKITKQLTIESATSELLKNPTPAYTVLVVRCSCQKIVLSGLSCFQDDVACVVLTSYVSSQDCAE